ncbi:hypothetical protein HYV43_07300 [Candidatus Micrarchaeota archaeon]|nr:hypothetical protein [Candidatus Micrarchaeota archaeon]
MRGQLFSTDFLVSVLVITVALGLFVHSMEFSIRAFPADAPDASLLSSALLEHSQPLALDPARMTQSGCGGQATGLAWCYALQESDGPVSTRFYDSDAVPAGSLSVVYENGVPLGPAHAEAADVQALGGGRFTDRFAASSGQHYLLFSSSDGSAPASNGKAYVLVYVRVPVGMDRAGDFCVYQSVGSPARTVQDGCTAMRQCPALASTERLVACGSSRCSFSVRVCQGASG